MDLVFLEGLSVPVWAPVAAAYVFGALTAWLIFGGRDDEEEDTISARDRVRKKAAILQRDVGDMDEDQADRPLFPVNGDTPEAARIEVLENELRKAQELLFQTETDQKAAEAQLTDLDTALKRANGRLKLLIGTVKKVASSH